MHFFGLHVFQQQKNSKQDVIENMAYFYHFNGTGFTKRAVFSNYVSESEHLSLINHDSEKMLRACTIKTIDK